MGTMKTSAVIALFVEYADEIDHGIGIPDGMLKFFGIVDVGIDLFDAGREHAQQMGIQIAAQYRNRMAILLQATDQGAANKSSSAEYGDS